jgi:UDP-4-amino-4,6-dideoxy-N-acetyl-beta-L-altrosamine N-acetyltransferase
MIHLRDIRPTDKEMIRNWRNLPGIARYMYTDHQITPEEHERWFLRIMDDPSCRYWIIVCDDVDVGLANIYDLDQRNRRCYWAFYIADPSTRGKGVGSFVEYSVLRYVFDELGLNKLCCEVLAFNEAVSNMHKSFGFEQEGFYREHIVKGEQPHDVVALAMLHSEWEVVKPGIEERLRKKGVL